FTALRHAHVVTASELLTAYHAMELSGRRPPAGCRPVLDWLAGIVGPIDGDRTFGVDVERLVQAGGPPACARGGSLAVRKGVRVQAVRPAGEGSWLRSRPEWRPSPPVKDRAAPAPARRCAPVHTTGSPTPARRAPARSHGSAWPAPGRSARLAHPS